MYLLYEFFYDILLAALHIARDESLLLRQGSVYRVTLSVRSRRERRRVQARYELFVALLPPKGITLVVLTNSCLPVFCPLNYCLCSPLKGADECIACASLQDGPHCVSSCPEGVMGGEEVIFKYPNKEGHCEPCHINCTQRSAIRKTHSF